MSKKKDSLKPWLSRPAVNRSVTLPLTRPLTQRLSNLNEFHPNELDPYLLFDAQSSMLGTLEASTLDLDPSDPSTLEVITATRAGTATYTDASGNIASAPANTVRVDHVDGVPMILVEPSATNLLPYSEDFSNAAWTKNNVTLTADYGIAPDGNNTSTRIQYSGTSYIQDSFAVSDYTVSAFVKGVAGQVVRFGIGANVAQGADFTLSGEWQRIEYTGSGGTIFFSTFGGNTATDFEIWGAQVEAGSVSTSYIPTSGSTVTRAADDLVISGSDFTDFYNATEGTFYVEAVPKGNDGSENYTFIIEYGTGNTDRVGFFYYVADGSLSVTGFNSNSQYYNQTKLGDSTNQLARISYSYQSGNHKSAINGTSDSDTDTVVPPANQLNLGKRLVGTNGSLVGHIKRLIYWPTHSDSL